MKKMIALVVMGLIFAVSAPAFAGAQQDKMKACNADAKVKALKGDERKAFMKVCLSKGGAPAAAAKKATQPEKKKSVTVEAKAR